jgi:uncharacterized BrkB/YihY/UPF0761 family membrane protein
MEENIVRIGWIGLSIITILAFCTLVFIAWRGGKRIIEAFFSALVASCILAIFSMALIPRIEIIENVQQAIGITAGILSVFSYPFGIAVRYSVRGALRWYRKVIT